MSSVSGSLERAGARVRMGRRRSGLRVLEAFRVAYHGLLVNKLRSFLTMLGVIVGVAAVIVMVALGQGAARATQAAIQKLGTNRLYIRPHEQESGGIRQGQGTGENLRLEDAEILRKSCRYLVAVAPEFRNSGVTVKAGNRNTRTDVYGSTPEYFGVRNLSLAEGRAFTAEEVARRARVAVLGHEVRHELFGSESPLGQTLRINGQRFRVIGVTARMGAVPYGNRDDQVTVPISTAMRRLFGADRIRSISAQAVSLERMKDAEEEVYRVLARAHRLKPGEPPDVRISNQADLTETANEQSTFLTMLLAGVALVSLVVGGIGIMNIMLVSVTERTREIGIRKALGARRSDILYQFLIESITLSVLGGVIGILLGLGVALWMGLPQDRGGPGFPMQLTVPPMVVAFVFSGFVGIFFGIYPAMKASGLNPIEALRYE